ERRGRPAGPRWGSRQRAETGHEPRDEDGARAVTAEKALGLGEARLRQGQLRDGALAVAAAEPVADIVAEACADDADEHDQGQMESVLPGEIAAEHEHRFLRSRKAHVAKEDDHEDGRVAEVLEQMTEIEHDDAEDSMAGIERGEGVMDN